MIHEPCSRTDKHGPHVWVHAQTGGSRDCNGHRGHEVHQAHVVGDAEVVPREDMAYFNGLSQDQLERIGYHVHMLFVQHVEPLVGDLRSMLEFNYLDGSFSIRIGPDMLIDRQKIAGYHFGGWEKP